MRQNSRIGHQRKLCNDNDAPREKRGIWQNIFNRLKPKDKATFYSPTEVWVMPAQSSRKPEEREFAVDSRASMHMLSKKDLSSDELELGTLRKSRNPTTVIAVNGEEQTSEEAQVFVHDLEQSCHWANSVKNTVLFLRVCQWSKKPQLIKNGKRVDPGLSSSSSARVRLPHRYRKTHLFESSNTTQ